MVVWSTTRVVAIVGTLVVDTDGSGGVVDNVGGWLLCGRQCGRVAIIIALVVDDTDGGGGLRHRVGGHCCSSSLSW